MKGELIKAIATTDPKKLHRMSSHELVNDLSDLDHHDHLTCSYLYQTLRETTSSVDYLVEKSKTYTSTETYPVNPLGRKMKTIAELIIGVSARRVYYVNMVGFDTHVSQPGTQQRLFNPYSEAVSAFVRDLKKNNCFKDTLILTFSEFGRRVKENARKGTDHGTAVPVFLIGGQLQKPGLFNAMPDLTNLSEGDLIYQVDFRSIYASLLEDWMVTATESVLGKNILSIPLISR